MQETDASISSHQKRPLVDLPKLLTASQLPSSPTALTDLTLTIKDLGLQGESEYNINNSMNQA
jgi:hypothetical protein